MKTLFDRLLIWVLAAILGTMTCVVVASVVFRYLLNNPLAWPEELASMLFAWMTFVGAYVGIRSRTHINIDTLVIILPANIRRAISRVADIAVLMLLVLFAYQGCRLTIRMWNIEFAAMEISRGYLYASLPVGASLMLMGLILSWRDRREPESGKEQRP